MYLSHAVDSVGTYDAQMCHVDPLLSTFLNEGHAAKTITIARKFGSNILQMKQKNIYINVKYCMLLLFCLHQSQFSVIDQHSYQQDHFYYYISRHKSFHNIVFIVQIYPPLHIRHMFLSFQKERGSSFLTDVENEIQEAPFCSLTYKSQHANL